MRRDATMALFGCTGNGRANDFKPDFSPVDIAEIGEHEGDWECLL